MTDKSKEITSFNQNFNLDLETLTEQISSQKNWESKYRQLMLTGKTLPMLSAEWRTEEYKVQGCESNVWLIHEWVDNRLILAISSDAKIVKGLVCLVLVAFNGKSAKAILNFDLDSYFDSLALFHQLSPSRTNGVHAIVKMILDLAEQEQEQEQNLS